MRLLIVDSLPASEREKIVGLNGRTDAQALAHVLVHFASDLEIKKFSTTEGEPLPDRVDLTSYAGVIWTGSPLSVNSSEPSVRIGQQLMSALIVNEVPCLGSCWGLQLAAVVLGGKVEPSKNGSQVNVQQQVELVNGGEAHPFFKNKERQFQAIEVHREEITRLPLGARPLATSPATEVKAAAFTFGNWYFWGTQYHPELEPRDLGVNLQIEGEKLVKEGAYGSVDSVLGLSRDLQNCGAAVLEQRYGVAPSLFEVESRATEIRNWLSSLERPDCVLSLTANRQSAQS